MRENSLGSMQPISPSKTENSKNPLAVKLADSYTPDYYFRPYLPDHNMDYAVNPQECYHGKSETLALVREAYGEDKVASWVMAQMVSIARFCGGKILASMNASTAAELSHMIVAKYFYLKVTEIILFVTNFKMGKYRQFYGEFSAKVIMDSLLDFLEERAIEDSKWQNKQNALETEKSAALSCSRAEYEELKRRAEQGDKQAQALLTKPN